MGFKLLFMVETITSGKNAIALEDKYGAHNYHPLPVVLHKGEADRLIQCDRHIRRHGGPNESFGDLDRDDRLDAVVFSTVHRALESAGVATAEALIFTASSVADVDQAIRLALELNPDIRILARTNYLTETFALDRAGAHRIVTAEGEVALTMTEFVLRSLGATFEQVERERERVRRELFGDSET